MVTPRILVVEDEAIVARDLKNKLRDMGYHVVGIASFGEQAVEKTGETLPDLVLMDIVLKGKIDGLEAAEQIRASFDIPVVYVTAYADDALLERAKITEPYGYILKPLGERELRTSIEIALYRHRVERELARYRDRLEDLVKERTSDLTMANEQLALEIQERKRAEEELLRSGEKYRRLFETLVDVYYRVDNEGRITMVSPSITKAAGYKPEDVIGSNVRDFYADPQEREQFLEDIMKKGHIAHFQVQMKRKDGSILWASVNARLIRDESGDGVGIEGIARDISEHKQAEEEIVRAKEEWERTFDSVSDLIAIIDDRHRMIRVNKAMAERSGIAQEEATGLTCHEHVHGTVCPPEFCPHTQLLADGQEHTVEVYEDRWKGEFLVTVSPLRDTQGRLIGSVHVARDITERKRAQDALQKAYEKLESRVEERTIELKAKTQHLEEFNTALRILLKQREEDKTEFEDALVNNVRNLLLPYIERLKKSRLDSNQGTYLAILESHINEITSTFVRKLSLQHLNLTTSEMQVAALVKEGKTTKEIAKILCVSGKAISFHRNNIRRKLGLNKNKTNLRSYLASLP